MLPHARWSGKVPFPMGSACTGRSCPYMMLQPKHSIAPHSGHLMTRCERAICTQSRWLRKHLLTDIPVRSPLVATAMLSVMRRDPQRYLHHLASEYQHIKPGALVPS
jgi:hypothetical protein